MLLRLILITLLSVLSVAHAGTAFKNKRKLKRVKLKDTIIMEVRRKLRNKSTTVKSIRYIKNYKSRTYFAIAKIDPNNKSFDLESIKSNDDVLWVRYDRQYIGEFRESTPNDTLFSKQHHHTIMRSVEAWKNMPRGNKNIIVAVTDDGFAIDHEDLKNNWAYNKKEIPNNGIDDDQNGYVDDVVGWDFNENDNNPGDGGGSGDHGTHCAGIVSATIGNGKGVAGFGNQVKVMPLKFYGKNGWKSSMVLEAYTYAANNGAKIISTSYNIDGMVSDKIYQEAVDYAYSAGVLILNSAGNGYRNNPTRQINQKVLLVGASQSGASKNSWDKKANFSNYGWGVDLFAPGNPIHSTMPKGKYADMSGTSMATPAAAGLAAVIWSMNPTWTREQVANALVNSAVNIDEQNPKYKTLMGLGRIDFLNAVMGNYRASEIYKTEVNMKDSEVVVWVNGIVNPFSVRKIVRFRTTNKLHKLQLKKPAFVGTNKIVLKIPRGIKGGKVVIDGTATDYLGNTVTINLVK